MGCDASFSHVSHQCSSLCTFESRCVQSCVLHPSSQGPKHTSTEAVHSDALFRNTVPIVVPIRPHLQTRLDEIEKVFVVLGASRPHMTLKSERLVEVVTTLGEKMDLEELTEAMRLLTGKHVLQDALPSQLTPLSFAQDVLGFEAVS
jgi:hypothetical protein